VRPAAFGARWTQAEDTATLARLGEQLAKIVDEETALYRDWRRGDVPSKAVYDNERSRLASERRALEEAKRQVLERRHILERAGSATASLREGLMEAAELDFEALTLEQWAALFDGLVGDVLIDEQGGPRFAGEAPSALPALQPYATRPTDPIRRAYVEDTLLSLATTVRWQAAEDGLTFRERALRLGKLRSAAWVNACLMLDEQGESPARVRDFLVEEGCGQQTWAATRLRFMRDALRAPFVFSYYLGDCCVAQASAAWKGARADFYACLYGRMHSPRSLQLAVEQSQRSS
jgi:hypothetical protein